MSRIQPLDPDASMYVSSHLRACAAEVAAYPPDKRLSLLRTMIVPLLEGLGYDLAHVASAPVTSQAFVLAADLEKRLASLEEALRTAQS